MLRKCKLFLYSFIAVFVLLFSFALGGGATVFEEGESYTFYCGSVSSQAQIVVCNKNAGFAKFFLSDVEGESTVYTDASVSSLEKKYFAELLFFESCGDVVNYYYSSPCFSSFVEVDGYKVNMHIAERKDSVCIGTPIIFGGY